MTDSSPLTAEQKRVAIRQKCEEAHPEGGWSRCECDRCSICMSKYNRRAVRLVDVLLAMQNRVGPIGVSINGHFLDCDDDCNGLHELGAYWNLHQDSLDDQPEPTIDFLHSLLCHDS